MDEYLKRVFEAVIQNEELERMSPGMGRLLVEQVRSRVRETTARIRFFNSFGSDSDMSSFFLCFPSLYSFLPSFSSIFVALPPFFDP